MEIKPQKIARKPLYAAALAAAASAAILTGCTAGRQVQLTGDSPVPVENNTVTELEISGDAPAPYEPDIEPAVIDIQQQITTAPVQSEPPAAPETLCPLCDDENARARLLGMSNAEGITEGFRQAGYHLTETDDLLELPDCTLQAALRDKDAGVMVLFYDGSAEENGVSCTELLRDTLSKLGAYPAASEEWGSIAMVPDTAGTHVAVFLDINRQEVFTETLAKQIADMIA